MCCPEDVDRCKKCRGKQNGLCPDCQVFLCWKCAQTIVFGQNLGIPMALANDNFWDYTCDIIYKYKVTYLEAAIVQPCWTSLLVCYVEGDYGHLYNEALHQQNYRTRVRGTAHSFEMPWQEILNELLKNCSGLSNFKETKLNNLFLKTRKVISMCKTKKRDSLVVRMESSVPRKIFFLFGNE